MIHVLWEFIVAPEQRAAFEAAYKSNGVWVQLFRRDPAYRETLLLHDSKLPGRYVTVDVWEDGDSYAQFKNCFAAEYQKIDQECEALTQSERHIGTFERIS